jgi:hypothetical protein
MMPTATPTFSNEPPTYSSTSTHHFEDAFASHVNQVQTKTEQVAENLDLLQDHLMDVANLVGIDPDHFLNFQGTDEDRETLLSLMNQSGGSPPLDVETSLHTITPQNYSSTSLGGSPDLGTLLGAFDDGSNLLDQNEFNQELLDLDALNSSRSEKANADHCNRNVIDPNSQQKSKSIKVQKNRQK